MEVPDGLAHTLPHSVVTIAPSVPDATSSTFKCMLCVHNTHLKMELGSSWMLHSFKAVPS